MLTLFKPYGTIEKEQAMFGDIVNVVGVTKPMGEERDREIREKLQVCDILKADVDIHVNKEFIKDAANLRAVLCASIGVDYVNISDMTEAGIIVANNPTFCIEAVAEYVIGLMFSIVRRIPKAVNGVLNENWLVRYECRGPEIRGKTIGLIGFGNIGREVARMSRGLGMKVIAYDAFMNESMAESIGVVPVTLDEIYEQADVISIHVPLLPSTRGMLDKEAFIKMKDGVYVINASRGGIIVEDDLLDACKCGKVAGAALDVLEQEPPEKHHRMVNLVEQNIIITPHVAFNTDESAERIRSLYYEQLQSVSNGQIPPAVVNQEVITHPRVTAWLADRK